MTESLYKCAYGKLVNVKDLKPNPKNNNKHSKEQIDRLAKIIAYQGQRSPIVVSNQSGFITKGHARLQAMKKLGWEKVAVDFQDYDSPEAEYADMTADNAIALWAELDLSAINCELPELGPDFDLEMLGVLNLKLDPSEIEGQCDEDEVPEPVAPKVVLGEVYILGNHRLMCGDSTAISSVERLMNGEKADMVWTDPPYNVAYEGKTKNKLKIENDSMSQESFYNFLLDAHKNMFLSTKPGGAIYVAHSDSEGANFRKALSNSGFLLKQCLIWVKQTLVMGRQDYHWKHEPILYGWADGGSHKWFSDRKQTTVLQFNKPSRNEHHPTMKPVELIEYCLKNSCPPNGSVLDLFGGSGSTSIASEKSGLKSFLMELDPIYCGVILDRWQKFTGKKAHREDGVLWDEIKIKE